MKYVWILALSLIAFTLPAQAEDDVAVKITGKISSVTVQTKDGPVEIKRDQDGKATIDPRYAKTSRNCPPFCIQPISPAPGVTTVGELELLDFLQKGGKLVDGRTVEWHTAGTIPGAVNMPYTEMADRLDELGCTRKNDKWDCANAEEVLMFCNGPWCGQSPMAIRAMIREGYPAAKIMYYRAGMQGWHQLGLTVVEGDL